MGQWDDEFTPWRGYPQEKDDIPERLPRVAPIAPLYSFHNAYEFAWRHEHGTLTEFKYESLAVRRFNKACHKINAWPVLKLRTRRLHSGSWANDLLFFVESSDHDAMLPQEDDICGMDIPGFSCREHLCLATRRENPCSSWKVQDDFWKKCLVFEVTLPYWRSEKLAQDFHGPKSLQNGDSMPRPSLQSRMEVFFQLRLSTSTKDAEISALDSLIRTSTVDSRVRAFEYTINFNNPHANISLFDKFPHMRDPIHNPKDVPHKLVERFQNLDTMQIQAYEDLLREIPDGVCILPGGTGAGKTHFNITVAATLLLKDETFLPDRGLCRNKTLFLLDVNKPCVDTANKMHQLCMELGLKKLVIRMYCWSYEQASARRSKRNAERDALLQGSFHVDAEEDEDLDGANGPPNSYDVDADKSKSARNHGFTDAFRKAEDSVLPNGESDNMVAPTLDQAARIWYEKHKDTKYESLRDLLEGDGNEPCDELLERHIKTLYYDVLQAADVLVTTPVTASKFSGDLRTQFQPTLVIFDEASHARELSTLISIANFKPVAWLFTGDHRQAKPFVGSHGKNTVINKCAEQLRVSMMERAYVAIPEMSSLFINHRAHGNLQELGSKLFYEGKMRPAKDPNEPGALLPSTLHLRQNYIMPLRRHSGPEVSRLLVVLKDIGPPVKVQQSWHHPQHQRWTMDLVTKLLHDPQFLRTNGKDPGSILVMSPYKQSFLEYRKAIKEVKSKHPKFEQRVVESRTVGIAQGHEADFVILDLVSDWITDHLEDPNRLCVALTRARQAEVILMHERMARKLGGSGRFRSGTLAKMLSLCVESGEYVKGPANLCSATEVLAAQPFTACNGDPAVQPSEASQILNFQLEDNLQQLALN